MKSGQHTLMFDVHYSIFEIPLNSLVHKAYY